MLAGVVAWASSGFTFFSVNNEDSVSIMFSIFRVQNFAHNISIPMDKDKNKGVGGWVESWWIV
jgi:hypothetical protein